MVKFNEDGARHISDITLLQYRRTCVCDFCVLILSYSDCTQFVDGVSEIEFAKYELESERLAYLPGESNATVFPSELLCLTYPW